MVKKALIIEGSPRRKGNTATTALLASKALTAKGYEVFLKHASDIQMDVFGCSGCMACQRSDEYKCAYKDELAMLVNSMPSFNLIVFCSPLYMAGISAQTKAVMDRMNCQIKWLDRNFSSGLEKTAIAFIVNAHGSFKDNNACIPSVKQFMGFFGGSDHLLRLNQVPYQAQMNDNEQMKQKIQEFIEEII